MQLQEVYARKCPHCHKKVEFHTGNPFKPTKCPNCQEKCVIIPGAKLGIVKA